MKLPDVLAPDLKIVICGTAAGSRSAEVKMYYAGSGNQFWDVLHKIRLTPCVLKPCEYSSLPSYGVGLTDLAKFACGNDGNICKQDYDVASFEAKILQYKPIVVAFNGKEAAANYFDCNTRQLSYGRQSRKIGMSTVYVLPSTSGSARRYWDISHWQDMITLIQGPKKS